VTPKTVTISGVEFHRVSTQLYTDGNRYRIAHWPDGGGHIVHMYCGDTIGVVASGPTFAAACRALRVRLASIARKFDL